MRRRIFGFLTVIGLMGGCDEYARTNPLDPDFDLQLILEGPDTIYSINDTVQFAITTQPALPELPFAWTSSDVVRLPPVATAPGSFVSLGNGKVTIGAEYGPHRVEKEVVVLQRAVRLRITPPAETEIGSLGQSVQLTAAVVDAKGTVVPGPTAAITWSTSDAAVADVTSGRVTSRSNGDVWIKAASSEKVDSVRIRVRQKAATVQFSNDNYTISMPGGSVRTVLTIRDARNNIIAGSSALIWTSSRPDLFPVSSDGVVRSNDAFGSAVITAKLDGMEAKTTVRVTGGTAPAVTRVAGGLTRLDTPGASTDVLLVEIDSRDAESDLEEATVDVYSTANPFSIFLASRVVQQLQGRSTYPSSLILQGLPAAGTVRVRLRDVAGNFSLAPTQASCNCTASVGNNPRAGSPDVILLSAQRLAGDSIDVNLIAVAGEAALRAVYVVGIDAAGAILFANGTAVQQAAGTTVSIHVGTRSADASRAARIGILVSDVNGNLSIIRTRGI